MGRGVVVLCALAATAMLAAQPDAPSVSTGEVKTCSDANSLPETVNTLGMKLRYIPAGAFVMGSGADETGREDDEAPRHTVRLTKGFYMSATEVTQGQWAKLMGTQPWAKYRRIATGENLPAILVTWEEAMSFCRKLSEREGRTYRLPTEAEWEYACRAQTRTAFYWGNEFDADCAWSSKNSDRRLHEVGRRRSNAWGLFDMGGNVWEWCSDWHGGYPDSAVTDPKGPETGTRRVLRGGSYSNSTGDCRSAERGLCEPGKQAGIIGLRIVTDFKKSPRPGPAEAGND
jgi:sulfatase modifying factor 1